MRNGLTASLVLFISLSLVGCGHDHGHHRAIVTQILSDAANDGDIALESGPTYTVSQGNTQTVFAGVDPATLAEYRAFLDFSLVGQDGVPFDAFIDSAILDIFIDNVDPNPLTGTIPIRIDLVYFQPPGLTSSNFSQNPILSRTINPPISQADYANHVYIDVTDMMAEVQRRGLPDFQVRISSDTLSPGLIIINDTTGSNRNSQAPLLQVSYF
ncbi:MAG TPA: hypothetical protein VK654_01640 [Nitrospirota bacterium]|nr:hypothetical protein [Nitrospirota bacterium]